MGFDDMTFEYVYIDRTIFCPSIETAAHTKGVFRR